MWSLSHEMMKNNYLEAKNNYLEATGDVNPILSIGATSRGTLLGWRSNMDLLTRETLSSGAILEYPGGGNFSNAWSAKNIPCGIFLAVCCDEEMTHSGRFWVIRDTGDWVQRTDDSKSVTRTHTHTREFYGGDVLAPLDYCCQQHTTSHSLLWWLSHSQ